MKGADFALMWVDGDLVEVPPPKILSRGEIEDVKMIRDWRGVRFTNIAWAAVQHPCASHEWGYGGTGPTNLSRDILLHFTEDADFARKYANEFRNKFLASMPRDGGRVAKEVILEFVARKQAAA